MKALINVMIYDFSEYREDMYILFDEQIIEVGKMADYIGSDVIEIDGCHHLLMPSLVNAHSHIYSTFARGLSLPFNPQNFQEILDQLWWKIDGELNLESIYSSGIVYGVDTVLNGVTTLIDHHASGKDIVGSLYTLRKAVCGEVGIRGLFCFETSDRFDVDACIKENMTLQSSAGLFGLHASMSLSDDTLQRVMDNRDYRPIHIHVAESQMDEVVCRSEHGCSVIERLDKYRLLEEDSLLAHCLYIGESDAKTIKKRGSAIVLNVTSNMNNGVGLPDYNLFKRHDIPVLIGNDGISTSITTEWLNLYYTMHLKCKSPTAFDLDDLLKIIDNNYAYASRRLGVKLGKIEKGYEADMLLMPYRAPTPIDSDNAFGHIFFGMANSFKPKDVWCGGNQVVSDYRVCKSVEHTYSQAIDVSKKLWERCHK